MKFRFSQFVTCFFILLFCIPRNAEASHMVGEDITWECINNCTTRVYLRVYRDCTGAAVISNSAITFTPTAPGCLQPVPLTAWSTQAVTEVTPICPSVPTACTNPLTAIAGVQEYFWFRDYDICGLGTNCTYDVSWGSCCRNGAITSGASNAGMGVVNHLDVSLGCNNSPQFTNNPLFLACQGTPYTIHQGAYDPDGDSLAFALTPCMTNAAVPVTYNAGYSATSPLGSSWNVNFDPATGMLELLPNPGNLVVGVVCFSVNEYRNGNLIGVTFRDMQVQVMACAPNAQPAYTPISNLSAGASLVSSSVIAVCPGIPLCFDISATDADSSNAQQVTLSWDGNIPGATFTEVGNAAVQNSITGNSPDGQFCWANPTVGVHQFLLKAKDNACPLFGLQDNLITIIVSNTGIPTPLITATGTVDTCAGSTVTLTASGGYANYLWSNAATTQSITVSAAGTYSVEASNLTGCPAVDSYTVVDMSVPEISGVITTSTSAALANQKVYLISHNSLLNSLTAEDSTYTDALGNYAFCGVPFDTIYVKAAPDSLAYPTEMPTYADTAVYWNNARPILSVNFPTTVSFSTRAGLNPGGPGFIGGLISQGANKRQGPGDPMPNVRVILRNATSGGIVDETLSDANGYFFFAGLALDNYEVSVDAPGVDEVTVPAVLLNAQTPVQDNLDFRLHSTYLELYTPTSVTPPLLNGMQFEAFPNPSRAATTVLVTVPADSDASLRVYDLKGREVATLHTGLLSSGEHRFAFDPASDALAGGIYFIRLDAPGFTQTIKFVALEQ